MARTRRPVHGYDDSCDYDASKPPQGELLQESRFFQFQGHAFPPGTPIKVDFLYVLIGEQVQVRSESGPTPNRPGQPSLGPLSVRTCLRQVNPQLMVIDTVPILKAVRDIHRDSQVIGRGDVFDFVLSNDAWILSSSGLDIMGGAWAKNSSASEEVLKHLYFGRNPFGGRDLNLKLNLIQSSNTKIRGPQYWFTKKYDTDLNCLSSIELYFTMGETASEYAPHYRTSDGYMFPDLPKPDVKDTEVENVGMSSLCHKLQGGLQEVKLEEVGEDGMDMIRRLAFDPETSPVIPKNLSNVDGKNFVTTRTPIGKANVLAGRGQQKSKAEIIGTTGTGNPKDAAVPMRIKFRKLQELKIVLPDLPPSDSRSHKSMPFDLSLWTRSIGENAPDHRTFSSESWGKTGRSLSLTNVGEVRWGPDSPTAISSDGGPSPSFHFNIPVLRAKLSKHLFVHNENDSNGSTFFSSNPGDLEVAVAKLVRYITDPDPQTFRFAHDIWTASGGGGSTRYRYDKQLNAYLGTEMHDRQETFMKRCKLYGGSNSSSMGISQSGIRCEMAVDFKAFDED